MKLRPWRKQLMVQSKLFNKYSEIEHFFLDKEEMQNRVKFAPLKREVCTLDQIHSDKVIFIKSLSEKKYQADALVTNKNIYIGVYTADCLPILLYDTEKKIIAAIHAGWRGLLNGVILNTVAYMVKIGSDKKRIVVAIGPHIKKCCFEISKELSDNFFKKYKYLNKKARGQSSHPGHEYFSLTEVALNQLKYTSILSTNIDTINICTFCDKKFYSYRRDHNKNGRMLNTIGLIY